MGALACAPSHNTSHCETLIHWPCGTPTALRKMIGFQTPEPAIGCLSQRLLRPGNPLHPIWCRIRAVTIIHPRIVTAVAFAALLLGHVSLALGQVPRDTVAVHRLMSTYLAAREFHDRDVLGALLDPLRLDSLQGTIVWLYEDFRERFPTAILSDTAPEFRGFWKETFERPPNANARRQIVTALQMVDSGRSPRQAAIGLLADVFIPPAHVQVDSSSFQFARWKADSAVFYVTEYQTIAAVSVRAAPERIIVIWAPSSDGWTLANIEISSSPAPVESPTEELRRRSLAGLPGVAVRVQIPEPEDLATVGVDTSVITTEVERRLRLGGVRVIDAAELTPGPIGYTCSAWVPVACPVLVVRVNARRINIAGVNLWQYVVRVTLNQGVMLARDTTILTVVPTWRSAVSFRLNREVEAINQRWHDLVDEFVVAYVAANTR